MNPDEFRREMEAYRQAVDDQAKALKDSYYALDRQRARYQRLDATERVLANELLAEWVLSGDEAKRFDALALIDDFRIVSATPALRQLADRLESSSEPGAPYEWQKVNRLIGELAKNTG